MRAKKKVKNTGKYLRELSVVVVGIIITFGLSNWIGSCNEKKDMQRYMEAVHLELEENLVIVQEMFDFYDQAGKFAKYLYAASKQENLQADSLAKYDNVMRRISYLTYDASAFEMLKSSGAMRLIKDKNLLKSIMECYRKMEYAKSASDNNMVFRLNQSFEAILENGVADLDLREPKYQRLFNYFSIYTAGEGLFRDCKEQIEETLSSF